MFSRGGDRESEFGNIWSQVRDRIGLFPFVLGCLFWYTFVSPIYLAIVALFMGTGSEYFLNILVKN